MRPAVPEHLRQLVAQRANNRCEYCLLPQWAAVHKHGPDHIIPHQLKKTPSEMTIVRLSS